jgi:Zn-dependent protease with chaperone function
VVGHGLLLVAVVFVLIGTTLPLVLLLISLGAVGAAFTLIGAALKLVKVGESHVQGLRLDPEKQRPLWELVEKLAAELGAQRPREIVAGLDPTFFVTGVPVHCLNGRARGRTPYLSLPYCRVLSQPELAAIVGHELGHFRGADLWFSHRFFPIYRGTAESIAALSDGAEDLLHSLAVLPSLSVLTFFFDAFARAERRISRERELAADRAGVEVTSALTAASALVKAHAFGPLWERCLGGLRVHARNKGPAHYNLSVAFAELVRQESSPAVLDKLGAEQLTGHPTDTHPTLEVRLRALDRSLAETSEAALQTSPDPAAVELIAEHADLEDSLSEALYAELKDSWWR